MSPELTTAEWAQPLLQKTLAAFESGGPLCRVRLSDPTRTHRWIEPRDDESIGMWLARAGHGADLMGAVRVFVTVPGYGAVGKAGKLNTFDLDEQKQQVAEGILTPHLCFYAEDGPEGPCWYGVVPRDESGSLRSAIYAQTSRVQPGGAEGAHVAFVGLLNPLWRLP